MIPLTLMAARKAANLLITDNALQTAVKAVASQTDLILPSIQDSQITLTSISPDMADQNAQLTFPRVCLYCTQVRNLNLQKFRTFSGSVLLNTDVWFSADLLMPAEQGLHSYVQAVLAVLGANQGDWGDGLYFSGSYDVQFQPVRIGGFGFVESARIICSLDANLN